MNKVITLILLSILYINQAYTQIDSIDLDEVTISAGRAAQLYRDASRNIQIITLEEIRNLPVQSVNELLETILSMDVRQRGNQGVQADVSIRGGSFEQTLILLNGMKINDPQTGHHNMNLPVDISQIERIEVLEGPGSRVFGPNAFAGAINIITSSESTSKADAHVSYGEYNLWNAGAKVVNKTGEFVNSLSINHKSSDGHQPNTDFISNNLFFQSSGNFSQANIAFQGGYTTKAFGAQSFYTPRYPSQFEEVKTSFAAFTASTGNKTKITFRSYVRRNQDRFELFRDSAPSWYTTHNYHLTDIFSAELNATHQWNNWKTSLGIDYRTENILSNVLGKPLAEKRDVPGEKNALFTKSDTRQIASVFAEEVYTGSRLHVSAGALATWYSDYNWRAFAGADVSYRISNAFRMYTSVNQSLRIPTYTDLYYVGPTNLGNPNLKPEEAINYETGIKFMQQSIQFQTSVFMRDAKNLIDWVRMTDSEKWQSMNLTDLQTSGIEISAKWNIAKQYPKQPFTWISANYAYISNTKSSGQYISYYALDYLKHKFTATAHMRMHKNVYLTFVYNYQHRNGTYTAFDFETKNFVGEKQYSPYSTLDVSLKYQQKYYTIFVDANNIFNTQVIDFGNIPLSGRWIQAGIKISLDLTQMKTGQ